MMLDDGSQVGICLDRFQKSLSGSFEGIGEVVDSNHNCVGRQRKLRISTRSRLPMVDQPFALPCWRMPESGL